MRLYNKKEWSLIPWPTTKEGNRLRDFFTPLFTEGVTAFVANIETTIYILHIDDLFIPITVNDKQYHNSYVCSLYSLILYAEEEMKRHKMSLTALLLTPFLTLFKLWSRLSKINKLVIVNNFLLSTNLYPSLSSSQVHLIHQFFKDQFPDHAIIFRSLNSYTEKNLSNDLTKIDYTFITNRSVYLFNPENYQNLPSKKRWIIEKDKKLKKNFKILKHEDFKVSDASEIKRLYDLLYLEKYSYLNPAFTAFFFKEAIQQKIFTLSGIVYEGRLVGVIGFFKTKGIMATPIVGYDTNLPESLGLYRLLTILMLEESLSSNSLFHMSAGAGHFKRQRGAFQELESMGIATCHLPKYRQFIWKCLAFLCNRLGAPLLIKYRF